MKDYVKCITVADAVEILLKDCIRYVFPTTAEPTTEFIKLDNAINLLRLYPSEDVEPVVRCKDCKHFKSQTENTGVCFCHAPVHVAVIDFCSYGERKDDEID